MVMFNSDCLERERKCLEQELELEALRKELKWVTKELNLYQRWCARPKILKEIIHHPAQPRTSQCLYGIAAYDQCIFE